MNDEEPIRDELFSARRTDARELDVARRAVELAKQSHERDPRIGACAHVGYYLIDDGLAQLEREFRYGPSIIERAKRRVLGRPSPHGVCRGIAKLEIDGKVQQSSEIVLVDDAQSHDVRVILGEQDAA